MLSDSAICPMTGTIFSWLIEANVEHAYMIVNIKPLFFIPFSFPFDDSSGATVNKPHKSRSSRTLSASFAHKGSLLDEKTTNRTCFRTIP